MNVKELLVSLMDSSQHVVNLYLSDLDDRDLLVRPVEGANHIAWQLGHLIASEHKGMEAVKPGVSPKLPEGFLDAHAKQNAGTIESSNFLSKKAYLDLYAAQRRATKQILESLSDADLDRPAPESMRGYAPTVAHMFKIWGTHPMMHSGQFAVLRRKLGKPVVM